MTANLGFPYSSPFQGEGRVRVALRSRCECPIKPLEAFPQEPEHEQDFPNKGELGDVQIVSRGKSFSNTIDDISQRGQHKKDSQPPGDITGLESKDTHVFIAFSFVIPIDP